MNIIKDDLCSNGEDARVVASVFEFLRIVAHVEGADGRPTLDGKAGARARNPSRAPTGQTHQGPLHPSNPPIPSPEAPVPPGLSSNAPGYYDFGSCEVQYIF